MEYPGVGIGIMIFRGNSLLLCERLSEFGKGKLALPGGKLDLFEDLDEAAKREVKEETGLTLTKQVRISYVTNDIHKDLGKHYLTIYYIADAEGEPQNLEPTKHANWRFVPLNDLEGMTEQLWEPLKALLLNHAFIGPNRRIWK